MTQLSLRLPAPRARRTDPATSKDAAASMRAAATPQCAKVLHVLKTWCKQGVYAPLGAEQIGFRLGMHAYAVRKRLSELEQAGLIETTGETHRTSTGRNERLWVAI